jgi:hypothetical protein
MVAVRMPVGKRTTCPLCCKKIHKYGDAKELPSGWVDQIIECTNCDWCGVESKLPADGKSTAKEEGLHGKEV